ncbi:MAG: leucyl aminopeptidase [candidate division KSB1 bacterium]|nr:leucyl aminopeptidase [candidate division KSB1 bacterium]MDZ7276429.1 leucyl aminopeptidase [candidate division KSB1 bacterium]MDZ7288099.1 leucyl aminopeptidase [candidate division KSB1 bacterium]MDZ7300200.1 leucyl aminopeptidase [candidate division KSB1 bacterium]MDZ7305771.1 leucyl aminopeptidase [candidate division KSB1 bacterium]
MEITIKISGPEAVPCAALLLMVPPVTAAQAPRLLNLPPSSRYLSAVQQRCHSGDFSGRADEIHWLYPAEAPAQRLLLAGYGWREGEAEQRKSAPHLQQVIANAVAACRKLGVPELCVPVAGGLADQFGLRQAGQLISEAALLANYCFSKYKSKPAADDRPLRSLTLVAGSAADHAELEAGVKDGGLLAAWTNFARDLQNLPANALTPEMFAQMAQMKAAESGLSCRVFDEKMIRELGMGALLGVAQGSSNPPRFLVLETRAPDDGNTVVFIGKGITFDSGGLSIKSAEAMEKMKYDMSGAAVALAATCCLAQLPERPSLVCLLPLAENMPGGHALRPGDVVTACNGKTIEVADTDAEGRLILAEALAYAARFKPVAVIDVATLTGAVFSALGEVAAGLISNNPELAGRLKRAAAFTGERVWELPLYPDYLRNLESEIADIRNYPARKVGAGASHGAAFLSAFVNGYAWAHLDIAAVALQQRNTTLCPSPATGWGVRLLVQMCREWQRERKTAVRR